MHFQKRIGSSSAQLPGLLLLTELSHKNADGQTARRWRAGEDPSSLEYNEPNSVLSGSLTGSGQYHSLTTFPASLAQLWTDVTRHRVRQKATSTIILHRAGAWFKPSVTPRPNFVYRKRYLEFSTLHYDLDATRATSSC